MRSLFDLGCVLIVDRKQTSLLDADEGIRFRGFTIPELQNNLPARKQAGRESQPMTEGMLWLLMTGELPTLAQAEDVCKDLHERSTLPSHVIGAINNYPAGIMHPMTQFSSAVLALQTESKFAKAYEVGIPKNEYWKYSLEDSLDLIAKLPEVAARIYRNTFKDRSEPKSDPSLDWSANFAQMLGFEGHEDFADLMRLYMNIHSDHEGGNVSAHATHLVGSALADPYLSFSAGMNGLAGPLHGLANQVTCAMLYPTPFNMASFPTLHGDFVGMHCFRLRLVWDIFLLSSVGSIALD